MSNDFSRRHFLQVLAAGAATSAGALAACSSGDNGQSEGFGDVTAGNISALAIDQIKPVPGAPAFIGRDSNGLYAMTTTCTHQGCDLVSGTISTSSHTITCACHGSVFTFSGDVQAGPAARPLMHFKVDLATDGTITVHGATAVDSTIRTPVTSA
jgi:Rieske Fe-S protein